MSVYTSDMYAFLIHIRFVRSAYYYVAKCWRAPRTCLQTWQTAPAGIYFLNMRCLSCNPITAVLIAHPKPFGVNMSPELWL